MAGAALNNSYSRVSDTSNIWVRLFETASQTESRSGTRQQHDTAPKEAFGSVFFVCVHNWPQPERKAHRSQKNSTFANDESRSHTTQTEPQPKKSASKNV